MGAGLPQGDKHKLFPGLLPVLFSLAAIAILCWARLGPLPAGLLDVDGQPSTVVVDRHGERLYEARSADGTRQQTIDATAKDREFILHLLVLIAFRNPRLRAMRDKAAAEISKRMIELTLETKRTLDAQVEASSARVPCRADADHP